MFSVSISLGNLFTAPLLSSPFPLSAHPLPLSQSFHPPAVTPRLWLHLTGFCGWRNREREGEWHGRNEGKQDEKLISRRLKPPLFYLPRSTVSVAQGRRSETRSHKSGLWELLLLAMLPECTETTHLFDRE